MSNHVYMTGKFEAVSLELLDLINNFEEVVFVFEDSNLIDFETRKELLLFNLKGKKVKILTNYELKNLKLDLTDLVLRNPDERFKPSFINLKKIDVPENYFNYILDNHLFIYDEIFKMETEARYKHSVSVAKTAVEIAKSNKMCPDKPFIAAILHDIGKDISKDEEQKLMLNRFKKYMNESSVIYHQFTGSYLAKNKFKIRDKSILDAIKYHTTGNKKMGVVAKIVYCSDKIEPTRGYDSQFMIDACKNGIESGFKLVLDENVKFLTKNHVDLSKGLAAKTIKYYIGMERYEEILKNEQGRF